MIQKIKKGDRVSVLDEDLFGIVKQVNGTTITIETDEGFLLNFSQSELVVERSKKDIDTALFSEATVSQVISEKEGAKKRKAPKKRSREKLQPPMEVDLHIHQLVKSTKGMTNHDMLTLQLDTAKRQLEFAFQKRIQRIVFIHGVGEGVLKLELEYLLNRYENLKFYDANYQKYGQGATEVYIFQNKV
ncbi:Smr/MutS family protein [Hyunsoonleella rubra]|uniref:Smr/MutS family protein n=1 Tax=Hyunsoonleella rubra TaxID=1737062 RepID=A0ABW5TFN7_9FLAO